MTMELKYKNRIIDEWQDVPSIWDAVKYEVDKSGVMGNFILTGSAKPNRKDFWIAV